ncbi:hypothetical protein K438DRAFT_1999564 [Mycena galopus ATCC 62051]|nr:hypothetical protein K438DRAFT_1999564 [Mycena galopus ATCC 62051]
MRCDRLQRRPTACSKPGPVAQREYYAYHQQPTQHTLQLFTTPLSSRPRARPPSAAPSITCPTVRAASIASNHRADPFRCPTARYPRFMYAARRQRQHPPAALHALTASILSATMRPRTVHGRTETAHSRRSSNRDQDSAVLISESAAAPGSLSGTPTHRKRAGERVEGLLAAR